MKSITVKELIKLLEFYDEDSQVIFASDYGDRTNTQQVHFIDGDIRKVGISESAYSDSGYKVIDENEEDEDEELYLLLS